jgi:hypothetical protein
MVSINSAAQTAESSQIQAEAMSAEKRKEEAKQALYITRI